jgi:hypothetical protein
MEIEIVTKNKEATLYYDGRPAFSLGYNQPAGKIAGLGFISNGLCKVDFVELTSSDGVVIYADDFEEE